MMGNALLLVRKYHKLDQKELAKLLEISPSYLSELERDKKKPTITVLEKYQETFKLPASSLIYIHEALETGHGKGIAEKAIRILDWADE